jgi:hypothetical protein
LARNSLRKALVGAAVTGFAGVGLIIAPQVQADSVGAHSAPSGKGVVRISTAPGGFIDVQVIGRVDAAGSSGPAGGGCWVFLGDGVRQNFIAVDPITGSGTTRFGPLENGTYAIGGKCGDRRDLRAVTDLISPSYIGVTIDSSSATGEGAIQPPSEQTPKAPPQQHPQDFNADCAGADFFNDLSAALPIAPGALKMVDPAAVVANVACALNIAAYHGGTGNPEFGRRLCYAAQHVAEIVVGNVEDRVGQKVVGHDAPGVNWDFFHRMYPEVIPEDPTSLHC